MTKSRLEAFSDGVIAIIITIMVLGCRYTGDVGNRDCARARFQREVSMVIYLTAIPLAFYRPWIAFALYMSGRRCGWCRIGAWRRKLQIKLPAIKSKRSAVKLTHLC